MSESSITTAHQAVNTALAELRVASGLGGGQDLIDNVRFLQSVVRQAEHDVLHTVARLDSDGELTSRGVRPTAAVADLLGCTPKESRRIVALAGSVFPTSLHGEALEPRLPATATALGGWEIGRAHGEVIERALSTDAAGDSPPRSGPVSRYSSPTGPGCIGPTSWHTSPRTSSSGSTKTDPHRTTRTSRSTSYT
jgi:hypothetical protein